MIIIYHPLKLLEAVSFLENLALQGLMKKEIDPHKEILTTLLKDFD